MCVVSSTAEGRLTVLSDIDVVLVVEGPPGDVLEVVLRVGGRARELGVKDEVPLDLKVMTAGEFEELRRRGVFREVAEVT